MSLKKVSQKWKATLLAIDFTLLIAAVAILGYCGYLIYDMTVAKDLQRLEADIQSQAQLVVQLEDQIDRQTAHVAQAEAESKDALLQAETLVETARTAHDAVFQSHAEISAQIEQLENSVTLQEQLKEDIARVRNEYAQAIRRLEELILAGESDYRICYLTFDDGPSYLTPSFLDKIDGLDIYVTFFTIGVQMGDKGADLRNSLLRREALGGHAIANHTYTHSIYGSLYTSLDNFMNAVHKQDALVYEVTGMHTDLVRFPAGSYYCPFRNQAIAALEEEGYGWIDWIANAYDSGTNVQPTKRVVANVIWMVRQDLVSVVLMHDWRSETLGALEEIVETLKAENYLFLPLFKESTTVGTAKPRWD